MGDGPVRYSDGWADVSGGTFRRDNLRELGTHTPPVNVDQNSKFAVRVTAGQDACVIYNTDTDTICVDSRLPIRQQVTGLC